MSRIIKGLIEELKGMSESEAPAIIEKAVAALDALNTESKDEITKLKDENTLSSKELEDKIKELENKPHANVADQTIIDRLALLEKEHKELSEKYTTETTARTKAERDAELLKVESKLLNEFKEAGAMFPELLVKEHIEKFRISGDELLSGEGDAIIKGKDYVANHKKEHEKYYSAVIGGGSGNPGGSQTSNTQTSKSVSWADVAASANK